MSDKDNSELEESLSPSQSKRREALIKLGKYAAYTAPAMMVTASAQRAFAQEAPGSSVTTTTPEPTTTAESTTTTTTTTVAPATTPDIECSASQEDTDAPVVCAE